MKPSTTDIIEQLASDSGAIKPLREPKAQALRLLAVLVVYVLVMHTIMGTRQDMGTQWERPLFVIEILLLSIVALSGVIGAVTAMVPDNYQRPGLLRWPFMAAVVLVAVVLVQFLLPVDARMVLPTSGNPMECALCIAGVSIVPSALIFMMLRHGATVHPLKAGALAVLASSALGGLVVRLAEANDSLEHVVLWHYLPTLLFATFGARLGKWLLKW